MNSVTDFFEKSFGQEIYENMLKIREDHDLTEKLMNMQFKCGIDPIDAKQNADACISAVVFCDSIRNRIFEDPPAVFQDFLKSVAQDEHREMILLKLLFGLTAYENEKLAPKLARGVPPEELFFKEFYPENKGKRTPEALEQEVLLAMRAYRVSAEVLGAIVQKWKKSGDCLATASALAEGDLSIKCQMTMSCFLEEAGKLTMEEAANLACCSAELQKESDELGQRMLKRDLAKKILIVTGITLVVAGLVYAVYQAGFGAACLKAAAEAKHVMLPVPEIFAEIASVGGSEPIGWIMTRAEVIRECRLDKAAMAKKRCIAGSSVSLIGAACVGFSSKFADCIGGLGKGFTRDKQSHLEGMQCLSEYIGGIDDTQSDSVYDTPVTANHSISQKYLVNAIC